MIKSILQFFTKVKKQEIQEKSQSIETDNILSFILDKDGNPFVKIIINDTSELASLRFGTMINNINYGQFQNSILDVLIKESNHSNEYKEFKQNIILYWNLAETEYHKSVSDEIEQPYISPLAFSAILNSK
jgi:hypothetical protein